MGDEFPKEYDVIVVGTGMTESILAAAASRVGKRVLHLDSNEYYGGLWASFNFDGLQQWVNDCQKPKDETECAASPQLDAGETAVRMRVLNPPTATNVKEQWHVPEHVESSGEEGKKAWSQEEVKKLYRKFNIDLAPKLLYSRGALVELLISSNIARYTEFRNVSRVVTWHDGKLTPVPCSRADVFSTQNISVVEKRMLMNLLQECTEYESNPDKLKGNETQTFLDFLKGKNLTDNLMHYVLYAIAMATEDTPCIEGMARTQKFLLSLGRYGNTPFLWPMYGSGEIPQAFCRLCAVFGGLYHLKRGAEALVVGSDNVLRAIHSDGENLKTNYLVMGLDYAPNSFLPENSPGMSRAVFVIDGSILPAEKEHLTLLEFPPSEENSDPVTIIEVGSLTHACPSGLYMVHMTTKQKGSAEEDLMPVAKKLLNFPGDGCESKPNLVWSMFFNMNDTSTCDLGANTPSNLFLTSGPDLDLDFDFAIKQAKEIFCKMYPEDEFLPRAPDPEEIILDDDEEPKKEEKAVEEQPQE
ncbi:rab proteins geranylgeranyltransferase component A 1 [Neocloeon triangulifer]|uniref:rab proteins geranylgeranyltransferase component A 1 n=1 Tax=Neocloeon triangulifer TaxID=2078957 RepID=UPI00286F2349|nr:rab proteins geranylgeranyltransferase component A 1 [Neocloeon triangulifer]